MPPVLDHVRGVDVPVEYRDLLAALSQDRLSRIATEEIRFSDGGSEHVSYTVHATCEFVCNIKAISARVAFAKPKMNILALPIRQSARKVPDSWLMLRMGPRKGCRNDKARASNTG